MATGAASAGALLCLSAAAQAQDICIECQDPRVTYRCAAAGQPTRPGDVRLGLVCITELAKQGGHSSCSVSRRQTGACEGVLKTVAIGGDAPTVLGRPPGPAGSPPGVAVPPGPAPAAPQAVKADKPKKGPPATVEELAKQTAKSSKEQLEKAGDGVKNAAKKTWRCLTSLFNEC